MVRKVARTDANVLITGENGTGKELIAQEIHRLSLRSKEILVSVDMGSLSETLFESELFGHVKGAFTDARENRQGKFEIAHKGTLFLDEIGNLSFHLQAKLLAAIQNRQITRIGSNQVIPRYQAHLRDKQKHREPGSDRTVPGGSSLPDQYYPY